MVYSQGAIPCGMPGNGTARVVPDRTAYLPVMSAEREGVHSASTLKLVKRMPSAASASMRGVAAPRMIPPP